MRPVADGGVDRPTPGPGRAQEVRQTVTEDRTGGVKDTPVRSVERALALLQCFDLDTDMLTLRELSERLSLAPSTTLRLASVLTNLGFLEKSRSKAYSLGRMVYLLGAVARAHFKLQRVVLPHMLAVRDACKEAVSLYGMEGGDRVCYEHVESLLSMRCVVRVGDRFPLWAGASGKCLLAYADAAVVESEIRKARPITGTTIVDRERFLKDLAEIRARGGEAISYGEREEGVISIAVPIFSAPSKAAYALSVAAPASRVDDATLERLFALSRTAAAAIQRQLYL
jgi:DNA-binding IclR family transcriptional regulator